MLKRKGFLTMTAALLAAGLLLVGCSQGKQSATPAPNPLQENWNDVMAQSKGQTVNMYMWGGDDSINRYIDEWVAPRLKQQSGVTLHRVPMNDTKDIINQLLAEKQAGKKNGSMDIIWINGENFKAAKGNQLLYGSFEAKLPNVQQYVNQDVPDIKNDFGLPTDGMEVPWGKAQFVFAYDSAKVKNPPKSMKAIEDWAKQNPGKFTYPAPPDFTGSAFVRQALYQTTGGYKDYLKPFDAKALESKVTPLWDYLNTIKPYLWRQGQTYPESVDKLNQLYASGEVWMTMNYDPANASNEIKKGIFPNTTRTFVLDDGTLTNSHYLSIPFNSTHAAAAMVTINFMLSPDAQIAKLDPQNWGDGMSIDPKKLSPDDQKHLATIDRGIATLPEEELASHRVPEVPGDYVTFLDKGWMDNVAKK